MSSFDISTSIDDTYFCHDLIDRRVAKIEIRLAYNQETSTASTYYMTSYEWAMDPLNHSSRANGHELHCFCDVCDRSDAIGFTTCTCYQCDPTRLVDAYLPWAKLGQNGEQIETWGDEPYDALWHDLHNLPIASDNEPLVARTMYVPPKETSRVIHSHTLRDDIVEICEELVDALCIYSVSRISRVDGFTGKITYCLDQKAANDVAERYIATDACPKIAKPDAPSAKKPFSQMTDAEYLDIFNKANATPSPSREYLQSLISEWST